MYGEALPRITAAAHPTELYSCLCQAQLFGLSGPPHHGHVRLQNRILTSAREKASSVCSIHLDLAGQHPSKRLAEQYRTSGGAEACQANCWAALRAGRRDHALLWQLLALLIGRIGSSSCKPVQRRPKGVPGFRSHKQGGVNSDFPNQAAAAEQRESDLESLTRV